MNRTLFEIRSLLRRNKRARALAASIQSEPCQMHFYNWWVRESTNAWFYRFAKHRGLLDSSNKQIAFISVFGPREVLKYTKSDVTIFCTGENLSFYPEYADHCLGCEDVKLALGFEQFDKPGYMRFPIWLRACFAPELNEKQLLEAIQNLRFPNINDKNRFCALIASHDKNGLRGEMVEALSVIDKVSCAGSYMHNDDSLGLDFADNKKAYLQKFIFNICPENSNAQGYCTEKVFDAITAGCIPIYWGCYNQPEPEILNSDAIIFWNKGGDNDATIKRISYLKGHPKELQDFLMQPRIQEGVEEIILGYFDRLEDALRQIL